MIAAGLWNPIVFRRVNKSWMADDFIPVLESFYPSWEERLNTRFYHPKPVWRILASKQEQDLWHEKKSLEGFSPYLFNPKPLFHDFFGKDNSFGEGEVRHAGYLDLPEFLISTKRYFEKKGFYLSTSVPETDLSNFREMLPKAPEALIDARGYRSGFSNDWNYLPWGLTKGEVLTLRIPNLKSDRTFNSGFFLLPLGNDLFRLGATFNWEDKDENPTEKAKEELLTKFRRYFKTEFEVVGHRAGVRPTVQDRRPLMGKHPEHDFLFLFNGLGTKGVMLAPFLSNHFVDYLIGGETLMKEVDISRFENLYGKKDNHINHPIP